MGECIDCETDLKKSDVWTIQLNDDREIDLSNGRCLPCATYHLYHEVGRLRRENDELRYRVAELEAGIAGYVKEVEALIRP